MSTPDYVLTESHTFGPGPADKRTLEAGSFVRPIHIYYVPKNLLDGHDSEKEIFCYTRYGIISIPLKIVRRT